MTRVTPIITVPYGTSIYPSASKEVDLSKPFTYTVSGTEETRFYLVVVDFYKNVARDLWDDMFSVSTVTAGHQVSRDANK